MESSTSITRNACTRSSRQAIHVHVHAQAQDSGSGSLALALPGRTVLRLVQRRGPYHASSSPDGRALQCAALLLHCSGRTENKERTQVARANAPAAGWPGHWARKCSEMNARAQGHQTSTMQRRPKGWIQHVQGPRPLHRPCQLSRWWCVGLEHLMVIRRTGRVPRDLLAHRQPPRRSTFSADEILLPTPQPRDRSTRARPEPCRPPYPRFSPVVLVIASQWLTRIEG